jgi:Flp pilus assembly pilin Flp
LQRIFRHQDGQASVEYAVLASLISIAAIALIAALGLGVQGLFQTVVGLWP